MDGGRSAWAVAALLAPALALAAVVFLLPFALLLAAGFWSQPPGSWIVDTSFTTRNYERLLADPYFHGVLARTLAISAAATALCLALGFPVARFIVAAGPRVRSLLIVLLLLPLACGTLLQTLGLLNLLGPLGVLNGTLKALGLVDRAVPLLGTPTGVVVGLVQGFLPLMVLPLVTVLSRLPRDLEAAAASLGAGRLRVLGRVVLPLAAPGIAAGCTLVFTASVTSFVTPQVLGQGKVQMFGTVAYQQGAQVLDWPFASALAVAMLALLGVLAAIAAGLRAGLRAGRRRPAPAAA